MLIVEDDAGARTALRYVLTYAGHDVTAVGTVGEAMAALASSAAASARPDLVVLDLMLPDGDGADVLRAVRNAGGPHTPVAVTTGVDDPDRLRSVQALGPDRLLQKPINIDELLRLL